MNDAIPRARTALLAAARGLLLAVLAPALNIVLLVATILSLVFLPLGVGIFQREHQPAGLGTARRGVRAPAVAVVAAV